LHDRSVTDSVESQLPAKLSARIHEFLQLAVGVASPAPKARLTFVVGERPRRGTREAASLSQRRTRTDLRESCTHPSYHTQRWWILWLSCGRPSLRGLDE